MSHSGLGARGDLPCAVLCDGQGGTQALEDVKPSLMCSLGHLWGGLSEGPWRAGLASAQTQALRQGCHRSGCADPSSAQPRNQPLLPFPGLARVHLLEAPAG